MPVGRPHHHRTLSQNAAARRERHQRTVPVKIPAGVNEGNQMGIRGQGDAGSRGGPAAT